MEVAPRLLLQVVAQRSSGDHLLPGVLCLATLGVPAALQISPGGYAFGSTAEAATALTAAAAGS